MKYELLFNLGTDDAKHCNNQCGASLPLDPKQLTAGQIIELPASAYDYLVAEKGYTALLKTTT